MWRQVQTKSPKVIDSGEHLKTRTPNHGTQGSHFARPPQSACCILRRRCVLHTFGTMRIRQAGRADVPWLLAQLRLFAASYPVSLPLYGGDAHATLLLESMLDNDGADLLMIAERDDARPVGCIGASILATPYNPECLVAVEKWWWVSPADRGSRAGLMLLAVFEGWADLAGVAAVVTTEATSAISDRHLTRRGYTLAEKQWIRLTVPCVAGVA